MTKIYSSATIDLKHKSDLELDPGKIPFLIGKSILLKLISF